jgi:hypothetical protein
VAETMTSQAPTRRPYHGSCHCGQTKYIAYLTLPPPTVAVDPYPGTTIRIYKCNCSTCHKAGYFHVRLKDAPNDFVLLSPIDPENGGLVISVDSDPRRGIRPGPTNLCVLMSQLAAAAAPQGPTFSTLATHGYL